MEAKIITKEERVALVTKIVEALSIGDEDLKQDLYLLALSAPQAVSQDELHSVLMTTLSEKTHQNEDRQEFTKTHQDYLDLCDELLRRGVEEDNDEDDEEDEEYIPHVKIRNTPIREINMFEFPVGIHGTSFDRLILSHLLGKL